MHHQKLWWAQIDMCMSRYLETRNANLAWYFVDKTSDHRFSSGFLFKENWKAAEKGAFLLVILLTLSPSPFLCLFWSCWKIRLCPPIVFGICTMFEILCTPPPLAKVHWFSSCIITMFGLSDIQNIDTHGKMSRALF